jgi:hypothetical protein
MKIELNINFVPTKAILYDRAVAINGRRNEYKVVVVVHITVTEMNYTFGTVTDPYTPPESGVLHIYIFVNAVQYLTTQVTRNGLRVRCVKVARIDIAFLGNVERHDVVR